MPLSRLLQRPAQAACPAHLGFQQRLRLAKAKAAASRRAPTAGTARSGGGLWDEGESDWRRWNPPHALLNPRRGSGVLQRSWLQRARL